MRKMRLMAWAIALSAAAALLPPALAGEAAKIRIRGKIIAIDKKLRLVILNVGQRDGVRKGQAFIVHRDGQYINKVIVQDVTTPDTCAAHCLHIDRMNWVEVGDEATEWLAPDEKEPKGGQKQPKVIGVDRKLGLYILNVGERHGVQRGQSLTLTDAGEFSGKVVVLDVVGPDTCVAQAVKAPPKIAPQVGDDEPGPEQPRLEGERNIRGKVIAVDRMPGKVTAVDQRTGRVAVDLGTRQGVKKGDCFVVFREANYVGKLRVEEVTSESSSTASYLREFMKGAVEIGDGVAPTTVPAPERREGKAELPDPKVNALDKDRGHVTINFGQRQGLKKGDRFILFRDAEYVGMGVVDEVRPEESSAVYDRTKMKREPQVGDDAALRLKIDF